MQNKESMRAINNDYINIYIDVFILKTKVILRG